MTLKPVVGGTSRAQALGLSLRYATTRTSEATLTGQPGNTYTLSVTVPLSEVKPPQLNARITKALQNGFVPSLTMPGSAKHLPAESVKVKVTGNPPELHVDATFQGQPGDLSGRLKETQALDLSFTHPRGLPEFRVDLQLSELAVDRTPLERSLAEKGVGESKADLGAWKTEFEAAKAKAPSEAAALERARADAAQAMAEAESAVARARTAIDARSAQVPADRLATVLRGLDVPAGQAWRDAHLALGSARADLAKAEKLEQGRAEVAAAGVDPDEAGPKPDLPAARARVAACEAQLAQAERDVRTAFAQHPDASAHLALANATGDAVDRARSDALAQSLLRLNAATVRAHEVARRRADDPNTTYPQLIAGAEAEVRRLEEALARLEPVVAKVELGARGSDDAQRALFGVREDQSWVDWRKDKLGR